MLTHSSTTVTQHDIRLQDADVFDFHGFEVHFIRIGSVDGVLLPHCNIEGPDNARSGVPWSADEHILGVLRRVGLVDPALFTVEWAERLLSERGINPNDGISLAFRALRYGSLPETHDPEGSLYESDFRLTKQETIELVAAVRPMFPQPSNASPAAL